MALLRFRFTADFWKGLVPVALGGVVVLLQMLVFFPEAGNDAATGTGVEASIKIAPFNVWAHHASNIPLAFLGSVLFPALYAGLNPKQAWNNQPFRLAVLNFVVAMALFMLLSETGVREYHGNFGWGVIIGNYLLFMTALTAWLGHSPLRNQWQTKDWLVASAFALHVLAGVFYLAKILIFRNYF